MLNLEYLTVMVVKQRVCGNGIRCFGKYVLKTMLLREKKMSVETLGGIKNLVLTVERNSVKTIRVDITATFKTRDIQ